MFGPHLIVDGSRCDTRKLADRTLVEQVLSDYPAAIGMTKIGGPYMFEYQAPDPAYSGVSGLVVIAESHIAIHTFPALDYFTMDIFSCKNFDHEQAIEYIQRAFDVKDMDRMLVQRGLSFRGPHHGKHGATDELIAAAEARLARGIISNEPALDESDGTASATPEERTGGRMVWPQYGLTPDIGSFGDSAAQAAADGRGDAHVRTLWPDPEAPGCEPGQVLPAREPLQVNPTASVSGLLDKLCAAGGQGRALGRALEAWQRLLSAPGTVIALVASQPLVADGLRELLVFAIERGFVDALVLSADDVLADLAEALGYAHYDEDGRGVLRAPDRERALAVFAELVAEELSHATMSAPSDVWLALGRALPRRAPRKGVLQAAAAHGVRVFTPDLLGSALAPALLAGHGSAPRLALDPAEDLLRLARLLAEQPWLGTISVGEGAARATLAQARTLLPALGLRVPEDAGRVALGTPAPREPGALVVDVDAALALPLLLTGLAQRHPAARSNPLSGALRAVATGDDEDASATCAPAEEPALA